ncbi:MAG: glycosyltransferase family A protein [Actinomycetota bacterium]
MLSVIVTTHNTSAYIDECIESILASTTSDFEVIVVDDGSTDDTQTKLQRWSDRDDRVCVDYRDHQGRRAALVRAHQLAAGEALCWVDSDDRVHPDAFARSLATIDDEHQLVWTQRTPIDSAGRPRGDDRRNRIPYRPDQLLVDNMIFHLRTFTAELFATAGGIGDLESAIDWDMNLRMVEHTTPKHIPRRLYDYRIRTGRMGGTISQHLNGRIAVERAVARRGLPYRLVTNRTGWHIAKR